MWWLMALSRGIGRLKSLSYDVGQPCWLCRSGHPEFEKTPPLSYESVAASVLNDEYELYGKLNPPAARASIRN
jgi:hypothetical protein